MPPIRTLSAAAAAKPVKTERSHEENQERAYIAASRRSDRSLEARVESARRASEIHKRRTGRSLRVTEQDVVNEEMYEEEDDDLPAQYRRLTAHLNTNSSDFNRRLAAYLTNHVAMRQALDQAISNSYGQAGQPWSPSAASPQPMQSPWMQNPNMFGQQLQQSPTMIQPSMMHQPPVTHTPYPAPNSSGSESDVEQSRPGPISTNQLTHPMSMPASTLTSPMANFNFDLDQRTSGPAPPMHSEADTSTSNLGAQQSQSPSSGELRKPLNPQTQTEPNSPAFPSFPNNDRAVNPQQDPTAQQFPNPFMRPMAQQSPWSSSPPLITPGSSPFTSLSTSLPPETQMFLEQGFNFGGELFNQQPFYSYNPNIANQKQTDQSVYKGMSQTLAPDAFSSKLEQTAWPTPPSMSSEEITSPFTAVGNVKFGGDPQTHSMMPTTPGIATDGQPTPADEFSALIETSLWDNETPA